MLWHNAIAASLQSKTIEFTSCGIKYAISEEKTECTIVGFTDDSLTEFITPKFVEYSGKKYAVTSIGVAAFYDHLNLRSVKIGPSIKEIGANAFACNALRKVVFDAIDCKSELFDHSVFPSDGITEIVIGDQVKVIPAFAFRSLMDLISLDLGSSVEEIGQGAFPNCSSLCELTIPNSVKRIGISAFTALRVKTLTIPANVESIGYWAFSGDIECVNYNARNCKIGGWYAELSPFKRIQNVVFGDSVDEIPSWLFYDCKTLRTIDFGSSLKSIAYESFRGCDGIEQLAINGSIEKIEYGAFRNCKGIKHLTISENVTSIEPEAFHGCDAMETIVINSKNLTSCGDLWGSPFPNVVKKVIINEGVKNLPAFSFNECKGLTEVTLPSTLESIGKQAFQNCDNLTALCLPKGLNSLGEKVFAGCRRLTTLESQSVVPPAAYDNTFTNCEGVTLYVPAEALEAYRSATGWNKIADIRAIGGSGIADIASPEGVTVATIPGKCLIYSTDGLPVEVRIHTLEGVEIYRGNSAEIDLAAGIYTVQARHNKPVKIMVR